MFTMQLSLSLKLLLRSIVEFLKTGHIEFHWSVLEMLEENEENVPLNCINSYL